jgi:hypothetical protein
MSEIKLISEETDISSLKMRKMDWDVEVNSISYQIVRIDGYVHAIGGRWGENDFWMHPRNEDPTYDNLVEYYGNGCGVCWGIKYEPHNYIRTKWDETECYTSGGAMITRNGKDFYFCRSGIIEAQYLLQDIDEHPLDLNMYGFAEKMISRKVWWRSEPAVITHWVGHGQACVILEPDGIDRFTTPAEYANDDFMAYEERDIKTSIFDKHINWFRD